MSDSKVDLRELAFLQDIAEHPDDMAPRLIYADWLDDRGEEPSARAAFIRVQCELAGSEEYTARRRDLDKQQMTHLKKWKKDWSEPFRGWTRYVRFYRGFVEDVTINGRTFCKKAAQLFASGPIRRVRLSQVHGGEGEPPSQHVSLADVLACPELPRLRELDLSNLYVRAAAVEQLAACPAVTSLRLLDLSRSWIGLRGMAALTSSAHLSQLKVLLLSGSGAGEGLVGDAGCARLAAAPLAAHLEELDLSSEGLSDAGACALADGPSLRNLKTLRLDRNPALTDAGFAALFRSRHLLRLEALSFLGNPTITDASLQALARSPLLPRLRYLSLGGHAYPRRQVMIADAGIRELAQAPEVAALRYLDLSGHNLTDEGARAILESPYLANLGHLNLKGSPIGTRLRTALRKRYGVGVCTFSQ